MLIEFREWVEDRPSTPIQIDPSEVVTIRHFQYHSFRPAITQVILRNGREFTLSHPPEYVMKAIYNALQVEEHDD